MKKVKKVLSLLCHNLLHLFFLISFNDTEVRISMKKIIIQCVEINIYYRCKINTYSSHPPIKNSKNKVSTWNISNTKQTLHVMTVQDVSFNTIGKILIILLHLKNCIEE